MKEVLNVGVIGLGNRGSSLLENCILPQPGVRVLAVCDNYEDRREKGVQLVTAAGQPAPRAAADYREVLAMPRKVHGWKRRARRWHDECVYCRFAVFCAAWSAG